MNSKRTDNLLTSLAFLRSMNIATKIWLGISFLVAGYSLSTFLGYKQTGNQQVMISYISEEVFPATQLCQTALAEFDIQVKLYNDAVVMGETELLDQANAHAAEVDAILNRVINLGDSETENAKNVQTLLADLDVFSNQAFKVYTSLSGFDMDPEIQKEAAVLAGTQDALTNRLEGLLSNYSELLLSEMDSMKASSLRQVKLMITVFLAMLITAATVIAYIVTNGISRPLKRAVALADAVREGDLSQRLNLNTSDEIGQLAQSLDAMADGLGKKADLAEIIANGDLSAEAEIASDRDRFGKSLAHMVANLNSMMTEVLLSSGRVNDGANLINNSSESLSNGASSQAASLEEITASITELSSGTQNNADNAAHAETLANKTQQAAIEGVNKVEVLTEAMHDLTGASLEIAKIIKVIDDIAFQTNLLALNAAVEAARAGKHGKGFAVVAEEVRSLAGRSAKAASETSNLIEMVITKVENGSELTKDTSEAFSEIRSGVVETSELMSLIASASKQQAVGINEIGSGMQQIDAITQNNASGSQEMASAAQDLSRQAQGLQVILSKFTLKNQGQKSGAPVVESSFKGENYDAALELKVPAGSGW